MQHNTDSDLLNLRSALINKNYSVLKICNKKLVCATHVQS